MNQKAFQQQVYDENIFNDYQAGLGCSGFKIKTLKDLKIFQSIKLLKLKKGDHVLDVGCNAGELLNKIALTYQTKNWGIDISPKTIAFAKSHNPFSNHYQVGDAEKLNFPADYFDAVIATDLFEHVEKPHQVLTEMVRTLKPGSRFFIYCISRNNQATLRSLMQVFKHRHAWGDMNDHQPHLLVNRKIFKEKGFRILKIDYFHAFFSHLFDEFIIRPFLLAIEKNKGKLGKKSKSQASFSPLVMQMHRLAIQILLWLGEILDFPWRIFRQSDALIVIGEKNEKTSG